MEEQIGALRSSLICAFNQLLDLKDLNTGVHSTRLAEWALHVAGELGLDQSYLGDIEVAALLHDIGKIGISDAILNKPAKLTAEEYELMKKHPEYGWAVLRQVPGMERASLIILHHHESYDGKGYPGGLKGEEIPIGSRIVSVIDAFDAMVSSRPYRQGLPFEEAERRLLQASGTQFDARRRRTLPSAGASGNVLRVCRSRHRGLDRSVTFRRTIRSITRFYLCISPKSRLPAEIPFPNLRR